MMKKFLFFSLLLSIQGFSQSNIDKIKKHLNQNNSKSRLSHIEINDIIISDEFTTTSGATVCHVKQTFNGIPVLNLDSNFIIDHKGLVKESKKNNFIENFSTSAKKIQNKIEPLNALAKALQTTNDAYVSFEVEKLSNNTYKLIASSSDFVVNSRLGYFFSEKKELKLAYLFEYYSKIGDKDLWNIIIDANTGEVIEKQNNTLKCSFDREHSHSSQDNSFLFKKDNNLQLSLVTPGTTSYNVVPWNYESPNHYKVAFPTSIDGRATIVNPESTTALAPLTVAASPNGWHNNNSNIGSSTNATKFDYTRGNNVFAYSDLDNSNPTNITTYTNASSGTYPSLTFNYSYFGLSSSPIDNLEAATTNLFYMNNIMHDLWYQYGFNELNKNFQDKNYSRGGTAGDYVLAEAQDNSQSASPVYDNANFSTPADGINPRMQMYLWQHTDPIKVQITSGALTGTTYNAIDNSFTSGHVELPISPSNFTGEIVLYVDDNSDGISTDINDACSPATNLLTNKIAILRRGGCNFSSKVLAAQSAGAIAVIIVNNATGAWGIGGGNAGVTIPAIGLSKADGDALIASLASGSVNTTFINTDTNVYADGDFDNGIVAHEYGHGISTRLSGNCLNSSEQMGEGWSDWFWLMMQIKAGDTGVNARGIGTFTSNQPTNGLGIRRYPYSTDISINPHTYADLSSMWFTDSNNIEKVNVHAVGTVWATILWDLTWAYIGKYGYDSNIYNGTGGNNKVMKLVLDGIKIDGCSPSFITGRDAILQADQTATGGENYELIWRVFARRGVGYSATSGDSNTGVAGIKDNPTTLYNDVPPSLSNDEFIAEPLISIFPNPSNGEFELVTNSNLENAKIQVFDLNGRTVYTHSKAIESSQKINLNTLQSGIYILQIKGDNVNYSKKIIIE